MTLADCFSLSLSLDLTLGHCTAFRFVRRLLAVISVHVFIFIPFRALTNLYYILVASVLAPTFFSTTFFFLLPFFLTIPVMFSLIRVAEDILLFSTFFPVSPYCHYCSLSDRFSCVSLAGLITPISVLAYLILLIHLRMFSTSTCLPHARPFVGPAKLLLERGTSVFTHPHNHRGIPIKKTKSK